MSRVFKGFKNDSSREWLEKQINRETVNIDKINNTKDCYKFTQCSILNIDDYNNLRKLETFYNDSTADKNGEYYFNGEMNQSNFLQSNINTQNTVVNQLSSNLDNSMNLNLFGATNIHGGAYNFFNVDPSGLLFDTSCNNLFFTQNNDISYSLINSINNNSPQFDISNEQILCRL